MDIKVDGLVIKLVRWRTVGPDGAVTRRVFLIAEPMAIGKAKIGAPSGREGSAALGIPPRPSQLMHQTAVRRLAGQEAIDRATKTSFAC